MRRNQKLRAYRVWDVDQDYCVAYFAYTAKEAKKMYWKSYKFLNWKDNWINIQVVWVRNVNTCGDVAPGEIDATDALRRGIYTHLVCGCEGCYDDAVIVTEIGHVYCQICFAQHVGEQI